MISQHMQAQPSHEENGCPPKEPRRPRRVPRRQEYEQEGVHSVEEVDLRGNLHGAALAGHGEPFAAPEQVVSGEGERRERDAEENE